MRFQCGLYVRNNDFLAFLIEAVFNGTITVSWAWKNIDKNEEKFQKSFTSLKPIPLFSKLF